MEDKVEIDCFSTLDLPPNLRYVARQLVNMTNKTDIEFVSEAVITHIHVLLDNPARIGEGVRAKIANLVEMASSKHTPTSKR